MHFVRIFDYTRVLTGLVGLLVFTAGCDGGGDGTSSVTPATPPPGQSAADQAAARAKSYPANGKVAPASKPKTPAK